MSSQKERRRFFRVTDHVLMHYRAVSDMDSVAIEEVEPLSEQRAQTLRALNQVEEKLSQKMVKLKSEESELAEILSLLNNKINLLVGEDVIRHQTETSKRSIDVNISACGIAFPAKDRLSIGAMLEMDLTLTSSYVTLSVDAQVVGVDALIPEDGLDENCPYWIRADFVDITDVDQELLVQHVLKRQSEQLKAMRESRERGETSS